MFKVANEQDCNITYEFVDLRTNIKNYSGRHSFFNIKAIQVAMIGRAFQGVNLWIFLECRRKDKGTSKVLLFQISDNHSHIVYPLYISDYSGGRKASNRRFKHESRLK